MLLLRSPRTQPLLPVTGPAANRVYRSPSFTPLLKEGASNLSLRLSLHKVVLLKPAAISPIAGVLTLLVADILNPRIGKAMR